MPDLSALMVRRYESRSPTTRSTRRQILRARFGTLTGVERPVETGDFVSLDLSATVDGEDVAEAADKGLSYEVGSGELIEGIDDAIVGLPADETGLHHLAAGDHAGEDAEVTVTVSRSRSASCPSPTTSSPNWPAGSTPSTSSAATSSTVRRVKRVQRRAGPRRGARGAARPGRRPAAGVDRSGRGRRRQARRLNALDHDEAVRRGLEEQGNSREEFDTDLRNDGRKTVKAQLMLDAIADDEDIRVGQNDLTERCPDVAPVRRGPQQLLASCSTTTSCRPCSPTCAGADVRHGAAAATVTDAAGNEVDSSEFFGDPGRGPAHRADSPAATTPTLRERGRVRK